MIDIILRYASAKRNYLVGSTLFPKQQENIQLGGNACLWKGYTQSVRQGSWKKLTLNIDGKMSGFYAKQTVMEFAMKLLECHATSYMTVDAFRGNRDAEARHKKLEDALKGYVFTVRTTLTKT